MKSRNDGMDCDVSTFVTSRKNETLGSSTIHYVRLSNQLGMSQPRDSTSPRYSVLAAFFIGSVIVLHSLTHHLSNPAPVNIITWDVYGYYAYLPAAITYGDVHTYGFAEAHHQQYNISQTLFQIAEVNEQFRAPIYTIGMAIIWLPGYLVASLIAWLVPAYANDGLSPPFQWAVIMTNWVFMGLGLYYLRKTLLHITTDAVTAVTLVIVFLATNYYHYAVFEPGMSHTYLLSLYAVLLYYTIRWHQQPKVFATIAIGVSIAMLCLARPSEAISLFIPLLFGVISWSTLRSKLALIVVHWRQVVVLAITGISIVLIQVLYWKWSADVWFYNGYEAEHHFDWLSPHLREGLFSYRKGWLLYTPVMVLSIIGLFRLFVEDKKDKISEWRASVWVFFLLNLYIVFSWHIWWYASSFGSRALVQSYAVMAIPIAAVLAWSFRRKWSTVLVCSFALACFGLNHFQDWQYRNRILAFDNMTRSFYWNAWGSITFDVNAFYLLDNDERLANRDEFVAEPLLTYNALTDTSTVLTKVEIDGRMAVQQTPAQEYAGTQRYAIKSEEEANTLKGMWIEVNAKAQMSSTLFDNYKCAKLVFSSSGQEASSLWRGVNMQRYRSANEWFDVKYQLRLPDSLEKGAVLTLTSWNTSPDTIFIHEMEASVLVPK